MEANRPSLEGKKSLISTYKTSISSLRNDSKTIIHRNIVAKDVFKISIAVLLALTTFTSLIQLAEDSMPFKIVLISTSILNTVLSTIYSALNLERGIVKRDKIRRDCDNLLLEIDKILLISKAITDNEIDALIIKIRAIINQTNIEIEIKT